ncbi:MAG: hypothetical protein EXR41_02240 [Candidatus Methylopumilus sp.]|nr:hypothetical protein [Candidatus Methylopumilus sp.]
MKKILIILYFLSFCSCSLNPSFHSNRDPAIGDSSEFILNHSTWGKPKDKKIIVRSNGTDEEWIYERGILYIKGGLLTSIQEFKME